LLDGSCGSLLTEPRVEPEVESLGLPYFDESVEDGAELEPAEEDDDGSEEEGVALEPLEEPVVSDVELDGAELDDELGSLELLGEDALGVLEDDESLDDDDP
jgi:hypothetical protein